ncbi:glutamate-5-semialdehyde dehydrogenase [Bacillus massiliglaciei]|uniref:glutamate-5-semialdehyde dehydrogenase n=1 Tax=Bacillus massiliglaciei TaxID=1816693 RepID=UPI000A9F85C1|nr:glutamate-5-semialdehyde dehydrogenase [Bacillus massiliglaciei]
MNEVMEKGKLAKTASYVLSGCNTEQKNEALKKISAQLLIDRNVLIEENMKDLKVGKTKGLSESILDRIMINEERIQAMADAILLLTDLKDPIGEELEEIRKENGLIIQKKRVPIGVIGMIYEARPNVTVDAATLSLKTGNAVILRGSSSAQFSNRALVHSIQKALQHSELPTDAVQLIEDTSRETAKALFHLNEYLDVLIPRGGKKLIETVIKESTVPVLETGAGNCHIFIDETGQYEMAERIILNAKTQRPSVCNAIESLLIEENWYQTHGTQLLSTLIAKGIELRGDQTVASADSRIALADEADWAAEYLTLTLSVKIVKSVREAIAHINRYGTKHSESIITENKNHADLFQNGVDAAAVYHNASTRFTDGFEFGYGAEIGISTQKLHARGPMGLSALTSSKYFIYGNGQIRN